MDLFKQTFKLAFFVGLVLALVAVSAVLFVMTSLPSRQDLMGCMTTSMYQVQLCPGKPSYDKLSSISQHLQKAVVVTEDSRFWTHAGFDLTELQKSLEKNLKTGSYSRGGSTITQQLAKNLFLSGEKSMFRKIKEAMITLRLEKVLSKKEILERYLNVVQFGPGVFGVQAASQFYFKKRSSDLSVIESAFLAFLLPSPEKYSVSFFRRSLTPFAQGRLREIINNLFRYQRITQTEQSQAIAALANFGSGLAYQKKPEGFDMNQSEDADPEDSEPVQPPKGPKYEIPLEEVPQLPETIDADGQT
jgi:monofunctional glycosyltransferase